MGSIHSGYGNKTRRGSYITGKIKITNPYFVGKTLIRKLSLHGVRKLSGGWNIHDERNIHGERNFYGVRITKIYKSKMTYI